MDSCADISEAALDASPNERSVQIEAIGVYHLGPRGHKVVCKLLLRIRAINRQGLWAGYVPVPERATDRRPPPPPFTIKAAVFALFVVGLKFTLIVQVAWPTR